MRISLKAPENFKDVTYSKYLPLIYLSLQTVQDLILLSGNT